MESTADIKYDEKAGVASKSAKFEDFEILKPLGSGSFGQIFKVKRHKDNQIFVLKIIDTTGLDRECLLMQYVEIQMLAKAKSDHVVKYYDHFE